MSINRTAARRDGNERPIIDGLVAVGATVKQLSLKGVCDLLVGFRGVNYLIEVKEPKGKLTPDQIDFFEDWRGQKGIARNLDDALRIIGAID
jgi:hypothetical protein